MQCSNCGEDKSLSAYYGNGYIKKCKECVKTAVRLNRKKNAGYYRAYDRKRQKSKVRQASTQAVARRWRENNPEKYKAHTALNNAIRDGRLKKRPCEVCRRRDSHAHHADYSKPLEVRWLCPVHHKLAHKEAAK
jgi:hypothetical protein